VVPAAYIPTKSEKPDTIGQDAPASGWALNKTRRRGQYHSQGIGVMATYEVFQELSAIRGMCLSLFHATVHKPSDSSTKRDKTGGAHGRLAITWR
jgi:hypothetical protein